MTTATTQPAIAPPATPSAPVVDASQFVTYRSLVPLLGGVLVVLATMGSGLTVWILGSARAEAQVPLARVAAVEEARKGDVETARQQFAGLAGQVTLLRTEIRQDGVATRGKIDDLMLLLATGKVRTASPTPKSAAQVPTSTLEAP